MCLLILLVYAYPYSPRFGTTHPKGLMMRRNVVLTLSGILSRRHNANELHHASIFVRQDVAVEYVRAGEVQIGLPDRDPAGCNVCDVACGGRAGLRGGD